MRLIYPSPIGHRSRPQAAVPAESGFVLVLVMPVALMLILTALSMVSRSNSAAITSTQESRAQAARMAAEYGFNQLMAQVNTQYNSLNVPPLVFGSQIAIANSTGASYTVLSFTPPTPPAVSLCTESDSNNADLPVTIEGKLTVGSTNYRQTIIRTIRGCAPTSTLNTLRVRSFK
jgi:hypothetical protein